MKKLLSFFGIALLFFALTANVETYADDSKTEKVEIKTNAWNWQSQNGVVDKLLEEDGVKDAYFSSEDNIVVVEFCVDKTGVDNIRYTIETMGYSTELIGNKPEELNKYTEKK